MKPKTPVISNTMSSEIESWRVAPSPRTDQTRGTINKPIDIFLPGKWRVFLKGLGLWKENYTS